MKRIWTSLQEGLGFVGIAALLVIALTYGFYAGVLGPLEERSRQINGELTRHVGGKNPVMTEGARIIKAATPSERLEQFYRFFERDEPTTDWLAKLHLTAKASAVELGAGDYRLEDARGRLQQYRMKFPISGSYTQIRAFVEDALVEIPLMSLDELHFRRQRAADARIEAEITLTLHLPIRQAERQP